MGLRYEAWTVPWDSAGFKRKVAMVPDVEGTGSGSVQFLSMPGNPSVDISLAKFGRLGEIISESTTSLMRVIDCLPDGTNKIIDEWVVERDPKHHQESKTTSLTGWGLLSALDRALVYAFDYPANPTSQADHIWGGEQELGNPGFEDGQRRPQEWELEIDATAGTYTLSDGVDTTDPIAFNAQAGEISTAIQNDLGLIDDVTTAGTSVSPYLRTIYAVSPPIGINLTLDDSGLTGEGTLTESVEGEIMFSPWTANKYSPVPDPSGNYRRFEVTDEQAHSGTLSLAVRPNLIHPLSGRNPGIEQVLRVTPNQIYTWSIWIRPTNANDNFKIGVYSYGGDEQIVLSGVQNPPINTWTQLSIGPFIMPSGFGQARFIVFWANRTNSEYNPSVAYFDDGEVFEGLAPTSIGDIWTVLLDDATVDHAADPRGTVLDWLDYSSFTDAVDSGGNAWNEMALSFSARWGSTYGHVLDDTLNLGYEVELVPKDTPVGGKTHDLRIYNPMGRDDQPSVGLNTNKPVFGGDVISRAPKYSASLIASPDGSWTEAEDATSIANFGRLEMHHSAPEAADATSRDLIASNLFAFEAANRQAVEFKMVETLSGHRPFVHFRGGDTIAMSQPPGLLKQNRRVQRIDYVNTHPTQYTIVGSRVLRGEAAAYDLIRRMWRRMNRPGKFTPKGADPIPSTGALVIDVAAADAPEWEKAIARYQCDGVNDQVEIQAAINEMTLHSNANLNQGSLIQLSSGVFNIDMGAVPFAGVVFSYGVLQGMGPSGTILNGVVPSGVVADNPVVQLQGDNCVLRDISVEGGGATRVTGVQTDGFNALIISCYIDTNGLGLNLDGSSIRVIGNVILGVDGIVVVANTSGVIITGNEVDLPGTPIVYGGGNDPIRVLGNIGIPDLDSSAESPSNISNFSQAGTLSVGSGSFKLPFTLDAEIISVQLAAGASPTGADVIVDVNKNGSGPGDTIFTTQANRPTIPDGDANGVGAEATPDVTAISEGDFLVVDIDQVGSTTPGSDLTVTIEWRPV